VYRIVLNIKTEKTEQSSGKSVPASVNHVAKAAQLDEAVLIIVGVNAKGSPVSQGSGFILTSEGLAGSNYHVFRGVVRAFAGCCNGRKFEIRFVEGADLDKDLVVFQLYELGNAQIPQDLPHVSFGPSNTLKVGERVFAVGSPQGLQNTVSDGILSAIRDYNSVRYLQITAPISPGSSGGPVLDSDGRMVGVATFQFDGGQNLNFAVASDYIKPLLDQHFQVSIKEFQMLARRVINERRGTTSTGDLSKQDRESKESPLTGEFGGVVYNKTAAVSAHFEIIFLENDGILAGCMGVQRPLFGSGPLAGHISGSDLRFAVTSDLGKITFIGKRRKSALDGTYSVQHPDGTQEQGYFNLQRTNSKVWNQETLFSDCPTDADYNN
jgi:Trypsin-like peptidase domain